MLPSVSRQSLNPLLTTIFYCRTNFHLPTIHPRASSLVQFRFRSPFISYLRKKNRRNARQAQMGNRDELGTRLGGFGFPRAILGFVSAKIYITHPFIPDCTYHFTLEVHWHSDTETSPVSPTILPFYSRSPWDNAELRLHIKYHALLFIYVLTCSGSIWPIQLMKSYELKLK